MGKQTCLKHIWLFVLLWTTALIESERQFYQPASLSSQAQNKTLFSSSATFQDRALALLLFFRLHQGSRGGQNLVHNRDLEKHSAQKKPDITWRERWHPTARRAWNLQTSKAQTPLGSSVRLKACLQAMTLFLLTGGTLVPTTEMLCY